MLKTWDRIWWLWSILNKKYLLLLLYIK
jgi:hypothetical protein